MVKLSGFLIAVLAGGVLGSENPGSAGGPEGKWPKSWPQELEPLRKQSTTWVSGLAENTRHEIPFINRETFESAWPYILSLKSRGASITLLNGRHYYQNSKDNTAGVMILPALEGVSSGSLSVTRIVVMADGDIIDLNRIPLPPDTPIIDARFQDQ